MTHSPTPWEETLTPIVKAGNGGRVLLGGKPPLRDIRVLSEENFQHAKRCVNAHDALVAALERVRGWLPTPDRTNGLHEQIEAALALARGDEN